jgi:hypothetical protein
MYTDPSGLCAWYDVPCKIQLNRLTSRLGYDPGLSVWSTNELRRVNDWWDAGVRFTSNSSYLGDRWTPSNLSDTVNALDRVRNYVGTKTNSALGIRNGQLEFIKIEAGRLDPGAVGGLTDAPSNKVYLFLIPTQTERTTEVVIHEIGHVLDWQARPANSPWGWSATSKSWGTASGWSIVNGVWCQDPALAAFAPTVYAKTNQGEDFAETFLYVVEGGKIDFGEGVTTINTAREQAIRDAISALP